MELYSDKMIHNQSFLIARLIPKGPGQEIGLARYYGILHLEKHRKLFL